MRPIVISQLCDIYTCGVHHRFLVSGFEAAVPCTLVPLYRLAEGLSVKPLQHLRSSNRQERSTSASVEPLLRTASWMLSIQRLRGRPGGLVLFGRQWIILRGKRPSGILFTWPYHLSCISSTYRSIYSLDDQLQSDVCVTQSVSECNASDQTDQRRYTQRQKQQYSAKLSHDVCKPY